MWWADAFATGPALHRYAEWHPGNFPPVRVPSFVLNSSFHPKMQNAWARRPRILHFWMLFFFACVEHQYVAGCQDRRDVDAEGAQLQAGARECATHWPHLLIPQSRLLRLLQVVPNSANYPIID